MVLILQVIRFLKIFKFPQPIFTHSFLPIFLKRSVAYRFRKSYFFLNQTPFSLFPNYLPFGVDRVF